jgi:hypothetical protein
MRSKKRSKSKPDTDNRADRAECEQPELKSGEAESGCEMRLAASVAGSVIFGGYGAIAKAGPDGCIALAWRTKAGKPRVSVGYVGDDLEPNTWYRVNERGEFVEA